MTYFPDFQKNPTLDLLFTYTLPFFRALGLLGGTPPHKPSPHDVFSFPPALDLLIQDVVIHSLLEDLHDALKGLLIPEPFALHVFIPLEDMLVGLKLRRGLQSFFVHVLG